MSYWLSDPELFLYAIGTGPGDVHLWRCKKPASSLSSSSLVVPMKSDDFDYVSIVENHLELIGDMFDWDETDYKRLVKYIFKRRLLVNSQGFVIAEQYKVDQDGNKMMDDANQEVPAIYIRSQVLALKPYIPHLRERPIPLRKDSNVTKLTARVADLESKNKILDTNVTKLTAGQVAMTDTIDDLKSKNKTLKGKVTKLTADLNRVLEINASYSKEIWMNDLTNSEWVSFEGIYVLLLKGMETFYEDVVFLGYLGTFTVDDSSTNVRARYWYKIKFACSSDDDEYKAVCLEDLTPNKEKARFLQRVWVSFKSKGKTYLYRRNLSLAPSC